MVILYDAPQHPQTLTELDIEIDYWCLKNVQEFWKYYEFTSENIKEISVIEKKFPAIRYNYLQQKFNFYPGRRWGFEQISKDQRYLKNCVATWKSDPEYISFDCMAGQGELDFKKWFPYSKVEFFPNPSVDEQMDVLRRKVNELIETSEYLQREITKAEKAVFVDHLNRILEDVRADYKALGIKVPIKQVNPFLERFGYTISSTSHKKESRTIKRIIPQKSR